MKGMKELEKDLLKLLKEGGLILYTRHGIATVGVDQVNGLFQSCQYQRNLSEQGRHEAVYYGQMLRYWQIPSLCLSRQVLSVERLKQLNWLFQMFRYRLTLFCLRSLC